MAGWILFQPAWAAQEAWSNVRPQAPISAPGQSLELVQTRAAKKTKFVAQRQQREEQANERRVKQRREERLKLAPPEQKWEVKAEKVRLAVELSDGPFEFAWNGQLIGIQGKDVVFFDSKTGLRDRTRQLDAVLLDKVAGLELSGDREVLYIHGPSADNPKTKYGIYRVNLKTNEFEFRLVPTDFDGEGDQKRLVASFSKDWIAVSRGSSVDLYHWPTGRSLIFEFKDWMGKMNIVQLKGTQNGDLVFLAQGEGLQGEKANLFKLSTSGFDPENLAKPIKLLIQPFVESVLEDFVIAPNGEKAYLVPQGRLIGFWEVDFRLKKATFKQFTNPSEKIALDEIHLTPDGKILMVRTQNGIAFVDVVKNTVLAVEEIPQWLLSLNLAVRDGKTVFASGINREIDLNQPELTSLFEFTLPEDHSVPGPVQVKGKLPTTWAGMKDEDLE